MAPFRERLGGHSPEIPVRNMCVAHCSRLATTDFGGGKRGHFGRHSWNGKPPSGSWPPPPSAETADDVGNASYPQSCPKPQRPIRTPASGHSARAPFSAYCDLEKWPSPQDRHLTPRKHLTRGDLVFANDLDGRPYARLRLPSAKTARAGETQDVFLVGEGPLCPLAALRNLMEVVPADSSAPLFSWTDRNGAVRPMVKSTALSKINIILSTAGFGSSFGHSFRIGGASFYLAKGVPPEIVRIHGRWKSLAYEVYIRSFEQIASRHLSQVSS